MNFFEKYLLSFFSQNPLKTNQLIHVLQGKRTPSTLFLIEKHNLHPLFNITPHLFVVDIEKTVANYVHYELLELRSQGYVLTAKGIGLTTNFNQKEKLYNPSHLRWNTCWQEYFEVWQFLTQIYSEISYNCNRYRPLIKNHLIQQWVKEWIFSQNLSLENQSNQWVTEIFNLFKNLEMKEANFFSDHLSGHDHPGATRRQIAAKNEWTEDEYLVHLLTGVYKFLDQIESSDTNFLHQDLLKKISLKNYNGLSQSAYRTIQQLYLGKTFDEVAKMRRIKVGTVHEHVLEASLVNPNFNFRPFICSNDADKIKELVTKSPNIRYQIIKENIPQAIFMEYRLLQLEVLRERKNS